MDSFTAIQNDVTGRMGSDLFFASIPIIQEFTGTADNDTAEALGTTGRLQKGGKAGAAIIVHEAERAPKDPNVPGPEYECDILVRALELPKVNRGQNGTGKHSRIIGQYIEQLFHLWQVGPTVFTVRTSTPYSEPETGAVGRDVTLRITRALAPLPKCAAVRIVATPDDTLALSCPTPGAVIRFTTGGEFPDATAEEFVPPSIPSPGLGHTVRAVAYAADMAASNLTEWRQALA